MTPPALAGIKGAGKASFYQSAVNEMPICASPETVQLHKRLINCIAPSGLEINQQPLIHFEYSFRSNQAGFHSMNKAFCSRSVVDSRELSDDWEKVQALPLRKHEQSPNRFVWFGWRNYGSILPVNDRDCSMKFLARQLVVLGVALGLWALLVAVFALQFALIGSFSWREAFQQAVSPWGAWFVFMPVVVWISFRFPFGMGRLSSRLGIHLAVCAMVVAISQGVERYGMSHKFPDSKEKKAPQSGDKKNGPEVQFMRGMLSWRAGLDVLLYCSVVGVCQGITSFRRSQERERRAAELEARLTRSQLQALRMQINPHFLFNTLNAISTLIHVDPRAADDMLTDLSELLRRSLDAVEEMESPLEREIQFIRAYVAIEQRRFGERLQVKIDVQDGLSEAFVPSLILQPLVENAIRHGIEPLRTPGLVTVQARRDGPQLVLIVQDNGKGPAAETAPDSRTGGVGLANTQARLRGLYGANQHFSFGAVKPQGCVVEIRIPYHTVPGDISPNAAHVVS